MQGRRSIKFRWLGLGHVQQRLTQSQRRKLIGGIHQEFSVEVESVIREHCGNGSAVVTRFTAGAIAGKTNLSVYRYCAQHQEGVVLVVEQGERSARVVALQILLNRDNDTVLVTETKVCFRRRCIVSIEF
jgi:hypothetical protein